MQRQLFLAEEDIENLRNGRRRDKVSKSQDVHDRDERLPILWWIGHRLTPRMNTGSHRRSPRSIFAHYDSFGVWPHPCLSANAWVPTNSAFSSFYNQPSCSHTANPSLRS